MGKKTESPQPAKESATEEKQRVMCSHSEMTPIGKLVPNPINPNVHPDEQVNRLAAIIKFHGWRHPITVSKRSGFIVAGHCRLSAAQALKLEQVPVDYQEFESEAEEYAVLVADNVIAELAETDGPKMADILVKLDAENYPLELTGLDKEKIEDYVLGPTGDDFNPVNGEQPRLDELVPLMVKCPECKHEFDARKNEIISSTV